MQSHTCKIYIPVLFLRSEEICSDYYQSTQFGKILNYMQQNPRKCQLRENRGKRSMMIENIYKVEEAVNILTEMKNSNI